MHLDIFSTFSSFSSYSIISGLYKKSNSAFIGIRCTPAFLILVSRSTVLGLWVYNSHRTLAGNKRKKPFIFMVFRHLVSQRMKDARKFWHKYTNYRTVGQKFATNIHQTKNIYFYELVILYSWNKCTLNICKYLFIFM